MGKYIQKRLVGMIVLLFLVSIAAFALVRLMPGDAAFAYLNSINAPVTDAALAKACVRTAANQFPIYNDPDSHVRCLDSGTVPSVGDYGGKAARQRGRSAYKRDYVSRKFHAVLLAGVPSG